MIKAEVSEADQRSAPQSLRRDTLLTLAAAKMNAKYTRRMTDHLLREYKPGWDWFYSLDSS